MNKKFFLSLIGLAFAGKALTVLLPTCEVLTTIDSISDAVESYKGTGAIYNEHNGLRRKRSSGPYCIKDEKIQSKDGVTLDSGLYVFNVQNYQNNEEINLANDGADISSFLDNIVLYNCKESKCLQTSGSIIYKGSFYKVKKTGGAEAIDSYAQQCNYDNDFGKMCSKGANEFGLCLVKLSTNNLLEGKFVEANGETYEMLNIKGNLFTNAAETKGTIKIRTQPNIFALDNVLDDTPGSVGYFIENKSLKKCEAGICEIITNAPPGYYVNSGSKEGNNGNDAFIKCTISNCAVFPLTVDVSTCNEINDGKLISTGLCTKINQLVDNNGSYEIKKEHYTVIPFAETETNYLVHHNSNSEVFNFDPNPSTVYYSVISKKNAIYFNSEFNKVDHCASDKGELVNRLVDFCSTDSSGMYYTCVDGRCSAESQLDINDKEVKDTNEVNILVVYGSEGEAAESIKDIIKEDIHKANIVFVYDTKELKSDMETKYKDFDIYIYNSQYMSSLAPYLYNLNEGNFETVVKSSYDDKVLKSTSIHNGRLVGIPLELRIEVLYYSKILKSFNKEAPKTWDELIEICKSIGNIGYEKLCYGILLDDNKHAINSFYEYIYSCRDSINSSCPTSNDKSFTRALKKLKEIKKDINSEEIYLSDGESILNIAMNKNPVFVKYWLMGDSVLSLINKLGGSSYGVSELPGLNEGITGSSVISINAGFNKNRSDDDKILEVFNYLIAGNYQDNRFSFIEVFNLKNTKKFIDTGGKTTISLIPGIPGKRELWNEQGNYMQQIIGEAPFISENPDQFNENLNGIINDYVNGNEIKNTIKRIKSLVKDNSKDSEEDSDVEDNFGFDDEDTVGKEEKIYNIIYVGYGSDDNVKSWDESIKEKENLTIKEYKNEGLSDCKVKTNHVFKGWNTKEDGKGILYIPGDNIKISSDLTLYAQWEYVEPAPLDLKINEVKGCDNNIKQFFCIKKKEDDEIELKYFDVFNIKTINDKLNFDFDENLIREPEPRFTNLINKEINVLSLNINENKIKLKNKLPNKDLILEINGKLKRSNDDNEPEIVNENEEFLIMDCYDSCKRTQGYYLSENKKSVYKFVGNNVGEIDNSVIDSSIKSKSDCTENKIGKVGINNEDEVDKICIGKGKLIIFDKDNKNYIVLKGDAIDGTPFKDDENDVIVKVGENFILKNKFAEGGVKFYNVEDASITNELMNDYANYQMIDCREGGNCRGTSGYVKNTNGNIIAFVNDGNGKQSSTINEVVSDCEDKYIGLLVEDSNNNEMICLDKGTSKLVNPFNNDNSEKRFIIKKETEECKNDNKCNNSPFVDKEFDIAVKSGQNYIIRDKFNNEVNLLNDESNEIYNEFGSVEESLLLEKKFYIYDCRNGNCKQTLGYIKSGDKYFEFKNFVYEENGKQTQLGSIPQYDGKFEDDDKIHIIMSNEQINEYSIFKSESYLSGSESYVLVKRSEKYIVIDQINKVDKVNMVMKSTGEIIRNVGEATGLSESIGNYKIVYCIKNKCKETYGYVKTNENEVYAFDNNGGIENFRINIDGSVTNNMSCTGENIGKFNKDRSAICLAAKKYLAFENREEDSEKEYMLKGSKKPFESSDGMDSYAVINGKNYIVADPYIEEVNFVKKSDLTVVKGTETPSNPAEYIIVDCILHGNEDKVNVCHQTSGYVINNKRVYGFIGTNGGEDVTNKLYGGKECNDNNVGKYIIKEGEYYICVSGTKEVKFEKSEKSYMIVGGSAAENTPFTENDVSVTVKQGSYYVVRDKIIFNDNVQSGSGGVIEDVVYLVSNELGEYISISNLENNEKIDEIKENINKYDLVQCESGNCKKTNGYIKFKNEIYGFIGNVIGLVDNTNLVTTGECNINNSYNVGKLNDDGGMCIGEGQSVNFKIDEYIILRNNVAMDNTLFDENNSNVPIRSGRNYIIRDQFYNGVVLVDYNGGVKITKDNFASYVITNEKLILMDCVNGVCEETIGFVYINYKYYKYINDGNGLVVSTTLDINGIELNKDNSDIRYMIKGSELSESNTENIVMKKGEYYIVKDNFFEDNNEYCIYVNSQNEIRRTKICKENVYGGRYDGHVYKFEENKFKDVPENERINNIENGVYMLTVYEEDIKKEVMVNCRKNKCYKMTDEIIKGIEDMYQINNSGIFLFENTYKKDQALIDDKKLNDLTTISDKKLSLKSCVAGYCTEIQYGVIRYNEGLSVVKYKNGEILSGSFVDDCNKEGSVLENMDVCISKGNTFVNKETVGVGALIGTKLYQRTTANVIGIVSSGTYIYENKIIECTSYGCSEPTSFSGYDVNSEITTNDIYPLIYCKDKEKCDYVEKSDIYNGYYLNKEETELEEEKRYVVCIDGACEARQLNTIKVESNEYKVKYKEDEREFYFNNNEKLESIKYYYIEDNFKPGRHFNYPDSFIKEEEEQIPVRGILFKTDDFSVVAITEDKQPIGYIKTDESGIIKCQFNKEGKKECNTVTPIVPTIPDGCEGNNCGCRNDDGTGKIYEIDGTQFICIDSTKVPLISNEKNEYFMPIVDGLFGINNPDNNRYYIRVKIDEMGNVLTELGKEVVMYRYTGKQDGKYKIYEKDDALGNTSSETYEYKLVSWRPGQGFIKEIEYYVDGNNFDTQQ